ncbi:hypothetical protein N0V84_009791 [Fusarium piperis]|uniref:Uncharacterized protein n=1 Tax=Fusarium piperis TaxID=1435070 RepID=A0A9W8W5P5_9HYPO|nr:hypothetical protein N0V84_009791 [Fusarium piperis]
MSGPNTGTPIYTVSIPKSEVGNDDRLSRALQDIMGSGIWWTFHATDEHYIISSYTEPEELKRALKEKLRQI